jgi:phosphoglycolate phosphatase
MSGPRAPSSRAVLFDLDGTLVDSFPGIASAYHHVLDELGLSDIDDADIRTFIGPPIQEALRRYLGLSGSRLEEGVRIFRDHYGAYGLFRFAKYSGVEEMLLALRDQEFDLYIATSKLRSMAVDLIDHAGWTDLFKLVGGAEPDGTRHHKRDVIAWILTQLSDGTSPVAMVGDRAADIVGGRELGLPGIGVTWGYGTILELEDAGATITIDSPHQLPSALGKLR